MLREFTVKYVKKAILGIIFAACSFSLCEASWAQNRPDSSKTPKAVLAFYSKILIETEIRDVRAAIEFWMKKFAKMSDSEIEGHVYESMDSLHHDFKRGLIDWVMLDPENYFRIENDIDADLGPCPVIAGSTMRRYQLIVGSNSSISGVKDLKDKKIAVMEGNIAVKHFLSTMLWENKLQNMDEYFDELVERRTNPQIILSVFFGQVDACVTTANAFDTIAELNPQIRNRLKMVVETPGLINAVSLYRKGLDREIKERIETELGNLDKTADGKQVLALFRIDRLVPVRDSDLDSFREFYFKYLKLETERVQSKLVIKSNQP